jgi:hypothetical protein
MPCRSSVRIAVVGLLVSAVFTGACRRSAPARGHDDVSSVARDTAVVTAPFEEPAPIGVAASGARQFDLQAPGQRDSLRATLARERAQWRANDLRDYQFLLKVECFCPGARGWLLIEVRNGKAFKARDSAGKPVALTDWNTPSVDSLFAHVEATSGLDASVQITFDPRWHFPSYIRTVVRPGPDRWSIIEARDLRPI